MDRIPSFTIDHTKLQKGLYVSRRDLVGTHTLTTFDVRVCRPNIDTPMLPAAAHTIEHIIATLLRNDPEVSSEIIYWGPMGCMTGFYLIVKGHKEPTDYLHKLIEVFERVHTWGDAPIPGASAVECGNYLFQDLAAAKDIAANYLTTLHTCTDQNLQYPT